MTAKIKNSSGPQPVFENLSPYVPVSDAHKCCLKLDANEGPTPAVSISDFDPEMIRQYPNAAKLEQAIANRFGLDAMSVVVTAGADEAIDRVCRAFLGPDRNIVFPTPSFEMIRKYSLMRGADVRNVVWRTDFPVDQILDTADERTGVIAVVSPNNPTGATATEEDLSRLNKALPGCVLLVDQVYAEFEGNRESESLTQFCLENIPNSIVIRSFSKAWGMAGLRIGFAMGNLEIIEPLRSVGGPFSISSVSLCLALNAIKNGEPLMQQYVQRCQLERKELRNLFNEFGIDVIPSQGNFVFIDCEESKLNAEFVYQALKAQGILVRLFQQENSIRITCPGNQKDFQFLTSRLRSIFAPQAILFDMDGVLVDEAPSYREAIRQTCESFGVSVSTDVIARKKLLGDSNNDWIFTQQLLREAGIELDLATVTERFEQILQGTEDQPGLWEREVCLINRQWLKKLAGQFVLGIVTGRPGNDAGRFLSNHGIKEYFRTVICMEDGPAKPDPAVVVKAMNKLGVESAWMVGDTPDDATAAISAGLVAVGVIAPNDDIEFASAQLMESGAAKVFESLEQMGEVLP